MIISAQTSGNHSTNSSNWTPIPGLTLQLPEGVQDTVLVLLNVPNPWATGSNFPGGNFGVAVNGKVQAVYASFTYDEASPAATGRRPTTLAVPVSLATKAQTVQAMWQGVRGSQVLIDSPATMSVIF